MHTLLVIQNYLLLECIQIEISEKGNYHVLNKRQIIIITSQIPTSYCPQFDPI